MTVVFLCDYYHPFEIGGAERSAERLAIELTARGVTVVVVTPNYGAAPSEQVRGVPVIRLRFPQRLVPGTLARRLWTGNPMLQAWYAVRVASIVRRRRAAIVHVQNSPLVVAGWLAARASGARLVVTVRDLAYVEPAVEGPGPSLKVRADAVWSAAERRLKRAAVQSADAVVFVSAALRTLYMSSGQRRIASRARVIYNIAPPPSRLEPPRDSSTVLYVGKLSTGKGLHVLYEAARVLIARMPAVSFVVVGAAGTGYQPPPADVQAHVEMRGRLSSTEVERLMQRATVLVLPSVWPEPLSRVILEGMSQGIPIVATDAGGTREALEHDVSGLIVPAADPLALASALERVISEPGLGTRLARAARTAYTRTFGGDVIVPSVIQVYEEACERS